MATTRTALVDVRARWAQHVSELRKLGIPDEYCWPFPESLKESMRRFDEVAEHLREQPETYNKGGLWERHRTFLQEVVGYYTAEANARGELRTLRWTLVCSAVAALGGIVAALGAVAPIVSFVRALLGP